MREAEIVDLRMQSPCTVLVAGPTGSGKTVLVRGLISHASEVCKEAPVEVVYCYSVYQDAFEEMEAKEGVIFHKGLIDVESEWKKDGKHRWLVIDDLMSEASKDNKVNDLFTKYSHHYNITVIYLVQNLFKKELRTVSLNAHYLFVFKNPRDATTMTNLGKQMYPGNARFLVEAYADATRDAYGYLRIDMTQGGNVMTRLVGNYGGDAVTAYTQL